MFATYQGFCHRRSHSLGVGAVLQGSMGRLRRIQRNGGKGASNGSIATE